MQSDASALILLHLPEQTQKIGIKKSSCRYLAIDCNPAMPDITAVKFPDQGKIVSNGRRNRLVESIFRGAKEG